MDIDLHTLHRLAQTLASFAATSVWRSRAAIDGAYKLRVKPTHAIA